jgi:hypothetical protein
VNVRPILARHKPPKALRWLAPIGVLGVAGLAASGMFSASASTRNLPHTTPAALIAAVRSPAVSGFSGTVVSHLSLGLPDLPNLSTGDSGASIASLLTGSHTLQVWYGGAAEQRVALIGAMAETDLFRSGRQLWTWSSETRKAGHAVLASPKAAVPAATPSLVPSSDNLQSVTPSGVARAALAALDPTTKVTVDRHTEVADRAAYELILTPRESATRIGSVHIAVDGQTKIPLGVQVYARGASTPAIDVSFTSIRFTQPPDNYFTFSPPSGAKVTQLHLSQHLQLGSAGAAARRVAVTGSGWSRVASYKSGTKLKLAKSGLADVLTPVSGSWGKGGLIDSSLLSVLVTNSGQIYAGAVDPSALYAAAGAK